MRKDYVNIPGWGVDADPADKPNYPFKDYTGDDHKRLNWQRPTLQQPQVEILHSIERPGPSAVVGTTLPPRGLSGMLRRQAFKHSESTYKHWLMLLMADRVNVVEGLIQDLRRGYIPNIFEERGFKADWQHNRKEVVVKAAVLTTLVAAGIVLLAKKKR